MIPLLSLLIHLVSIYCRFSLEAPLIVTVDRIGRARHSTIIPTIGVVILERFIGSHIMLTSP